MHHIQATLFDDGLMHSLTLLARTIAPRGDGAFIQVKGLDDGLHRAAKSQQSHNNDNQLGRFA